MTSDARRPKNPVHLVLIIASVIAVLTGVGWLAENATPPAFTEAHKTAVAYELGLRDLRLPNSLSLTDGVVTAELELSDQYNAAADQRARELGEQYVLALRDALRRHGFRSYRVNVSRQRPEGAPPSRYGFTRLTDGGSVEWLR